MAHTICDIFDSPKIKIKREYFKLKNNSGTIRATQLEERVKEAAQIGNLQEEIQLHTIPTTKKDKDVARRLCLLLPQNKRIRGITTAHRN